MTTSSGGDHPRLQDPRPGPQSMARPMGKPRRETVSDLVARRSGGQRSGEQRSAVVPTGSLTGTAGGTPTPDTARSDAGTPDRNATWPEHDPEHTDGRSGDRAPGGPGALVPVAHADRNDDGTGTPGEDAPARERYPLVDTPRFASEAIHLQEFLDTAQDGNYAWNHILVVRAMNIAFAWLFTNTIARIAFAIVWSTAAFHRALAVYGIPFVVAQAVPVLPGLVMANWTPTTWGWIGGAVLVFGAATAVAAVKERTR